MEHMASRAERLSFKQEGIAADDKYSPVNTAFLLPTDPKDYPILSLDSPKTMSVSVGISKKDSSVPSEKP